MSTSAKSRKWPKPSENKEFLNFFRFSTVATSATSAVNYAPAENAPF